ncbi:LysR substrate-binding domain-containing protein [Paucibacter sp. KCTC 42545]|uniref:LysR substrate-binding domain-containing protein n=1 Tax=Paucibacter sp. KCTC 42545 TaxID=1768242 RepID=UPI000733AA4B|nr:LysR substrate-binding domain-containing protein [Paucibacter sp. KCTC 42545]ALT78241.1 LysR family transcriptional regulator [Paucibacter sp. KCTC 42545]
METKWFEDFVSLAETRSFSRSAQLRHVTQPAFSRRIQALEAWAGTDLVDRSSYPTRLTGAGETLLAQAVEILGNLQATRNMMRSHQSSDVDMIEFAVPHSLAFSFFPHWLMGLRQRFGALKCRLNALNVHDAMLQLSEGNCDLLIVYHHASQPLQLDPERYEMASLGQETLAAYAKADAKGRPMFQLPRQTKGKLASSNGHAGPKFPFLSYASGAYLGRLVELIAKGSAVPLNLDAIYETDMAEGLKAMALEGHGLTFLPASSVQQELRNGRLVQASAAGEFELTMELRIYRERPELSRRNKASALALWQFLTAA